MYQTPGTHLKHLGARSNFQTENPTDIRCYGTKFSRSVARNSRTPLQLVMCITIIIITKPCLLPDKW